MATDTNRTGLSYSAETTWGTNTAATMTDIRFTGESFAYNITNVQSAEIRSDRQITDIIQTGADCSGGFNFELSYSEYDVLLKAALWSSAWSTAISVSRTGEVGFNNTSGRIYTESGDFTTLTTGQWIKASGATNSGNNRFYRITSTATTGVGVVPSPPTTEATGTQTIALSGSYIRNGVTEHSFTFEREHSDAVQFFDYTGMVVNTLNISATADAVLSGDFAFIGKSATLAQVTGASGTTIVSQTNDVMNASSNVGEIFQGAFSSLVTKDTDLYISEISFSVNNNVRALRAIGNIASVDIGVGTCEVTGTLNAYFLNQVMYDKYLAGTATGLSFAVEDASGNAYIWSFPSIEFETDAVNSGGQNADVMENIGWRAKRHAGSDCQIQLDKIPA